MLAEQELNAILNIASPAPAQSYTNLDLHLMTTAFLNEQNAPELLPFKHALVGNLREMMEAQMCNLHLFNSQSDQIGDFIGAKIGHNMDLKAGNDHNMDFKPRNDQNTNGKTGEDDFITSLVLQQEMERIKFIIRAYLRVRVAKVG